MHIKQFRNGGIGCKIHGLHVVGRKRFEDDEYTSTISFLASDSSESEAKNKTVICLFNFFASFTSNYVKAMNFAIDSAISALFNGNFNVSDIVLQSKKKKNRMCVISQILRYQNDH